MTEQQNLDTVPQMAVDAPLSMAAAGRAAGDVSSVLLIRTIVAAVATIVLVVAAVLAAAMSSMSSASLYIDFSTRWTWSAFLVRTRSGNVKIFSFAI